MLIRNASLLQEPVLLERETQYSLVHKVQETLSFFDLKYYSEFF